MIGPKKVLPLKLSFDLSDLDVMSKLSLAVLVLAVFGLANSSSDDSGTGNAKLLVSKRVS